MKKEYLPLEITLRYLECVDIVTASPPKDENEGEGYQPDEDWWWGF